MPEAESLFFRCYCHTAFELPADRGVEMRRLVEDHTAGCPDYQRQARAGGQ